MAIKSALTLISRRIAAAVRDAAADQGLVPGDYVLVGSFDDKSDRISLTFGTDRPVEELRLYSKTFAEIGKRFPEFSQIKMHVGLVIRRVASLDEVYWANAQAEDDIDLTEMLDRN